MQVKRRRLPNFETCSVTLFATLALTTAMHSRAQTPSPSTPSVTSTTSTTPRGTSSSQITPQLSPTSGSAATIPANRWTGDQIAEAFKRTDANADGTITRQEAAIWSGLSRRFDQVDANKDGSISSAEFHESLK